MLSLGCTNGISHAQDLADTMTGDWGGLRRDWQQRGVTLRGDYVSESFRVTHGGLRQGSRYAQQIRLGADFDMSRLAGWSAGTFHLTLNDRAGRGVSSDLTGNRLPIQEVYSSQFAKLTELSYDQDMLDHRLNVKLGFSAMGNDFGGLPILCDLVNAAFCAHSLSFSGGSGWGNYPNSRWGVRARWTFSPTVDLKVGAFQVNPDYSTKAHAFSLDARGTTGAIFPVELDLHTPAGKKTEYLGELKIGGYYDNSRTPRKGRAGEVEGRHGFYVLGTQEVYHEHADSRRGLTLAGEWTNADPTTAQITRWYALAAIYQGTFPGRDQDTVALGYVRAVINPRLVQAHRQDNRGIVQDAFLDTLANAESVLELSYGWQATSWLLVRPDVQYVIHPGAYSYQHVPNVVAVGLQLKIVF